MLEIELLEHAIDSRELLFVVLFARSPPGRKHAHVFQTVDRVLCLVSFSCTKTKISKSNQNIYFLRCVSFSPSHAVTEGTVCLLEIYLIFEGNGRFRGVATRKSSLRARIYPWIEFKCKWKNSWKKRKKG